mgnify:CR=1 FL=1
MNKNSSHSSVEQVTNNATSWLGHHPRENKDIGRGQTFVAHTEGDVESIEVYTNIVSRPGNVVMTIHSFDPQQKSWGPTLGSANVDFNQSDNGKWKAFNIPSLHLNKGESYGFRLESQDSYIGVGEAAGSAKQPPFSAGQEWHFTPGNSKADAYSYFSLAFKVDIKS